MENLTAFRNKLAGMTDDELVAYHSEMQKHENIDYKMDGSGDCGDMIAKAWEPIWEAFEDELEERDIQLNDCYESDMPC